MKDEDSGMREIITSDDRNTENLSRIIITVEDGCVTSVYSDRPADVDIIDHDTDLDEEREEYNNRLVEELDNLFEVF